MGSCVDPWAGSSSRTGAWIEIAVDLQELDDEANLVATEERLGGSDDPRLAADLDAVANLEVALVVEVTGRDDLVASA